MVEMGDQLPLARQLSKWRLLKNKAVLVTEIFEAPLLKNEKAPVDPAIRQGRFFHEIANPLIHDLEITKPSRWLYRRHRANLSMLEMSAHEAGDVNIRHTVAIC